MSVLVLERIVSGVVVETKTQPPEPYIYRGAVQFTISLPREWMPYALKEWDLQYSRSSDNSVYSDWYDLGTFPGIIGTDDPTTPNVEGGIGTHTHQIVDLNTTQRYYRYRYRIRTNANQQSDWSEIGYAGVAGFLPIFPAPTYDIIDPDSLTDTVNNLTITGATFRTNENDPKVQMDYTGLYATDVAHHETFRIDAAGTVSIIGSMYAREGISMDAATSTSPPTTNRFSMLDGSDVVGEIFQYHSSMVSTTAYIRSGYAGSGLSQGGRITLEAIPDSGAGTAYVNVLSHATAISAEIQAQANGITKRIVTGAGGSDFILNGLSYTTPMTISQRYSVGFTVSAGSATSVALPHTGSGTYTYIGHVECSSAVPPSYAIDGSNLNIYNPAIGSISGTYYYNILSY